MPPTPAADIEFVRGSDDWKAKQEEARERANQARAEKAKEQHAVSNPRAGETVSGRVSRDTAPKDSVEFDPRIQQMSEQYRDDKNRERNRIAAMAGTSAATVAKVMFRARTLASRGKRWAGGADAAFLLTHRIGNARIAREGSAFVGLGQARCIVWRPGAVCQTLERLRTANSGKRVTGARTSFFAAIRRRAVGRRAEVRTEAAACAEKAGANDGSDKCNPRQVHALMVQRSQASRNGNCGQRPPPRGLLFGDALICQRRSVRKTRYLLGTAFSSPWSGSGRRPLRLLRLLHSVELVRRERLRSRLHMAVDLVVERDEAMARATLDALVAATEGAQ